MKRKRDERDDNITSGRREAIGKMMSRDYVTSGNERGDGVLG